MLVLSFTAGLYGASLQFTPAALLYRWTSLYQYAGTHVTILLSILIVAAGELTVSQPCLDAWVHQDQALRMSFSHWSSAILINDAL